MHLSTIDAGRLHKLEASANAVADVRSTSKQDLIDALTAGAEKMKGITFTESWCQAASAMEVAFASWCELGTGKRTQPLWDKVSELAGGSDAVATLFAGILEAAHAV